MISDKQSTTGTYISGALVIFIGLLITPIGITGFAAMGFKAIGAVLLLMAIVGIFLLVSGISMIIKTVRLEKDIKLMEQKNPGAEPEHTIAYKYSDIILTFAIDEQTWKDYTVNEKRYRNADSIFLFIGGILLGTFAIVRARHADIKTAFVITAFLMIVIVLLRRYINLNQLKSNAKEKKVVIADQYVVLNEHIFSLFSDNRNTTKVQLIENSKTIILEYTISWNTRSGPTFDELRIPVPLAQSEAVKAYVTNFRMKINQK